MREVNVTGPTVEEAIESALSQLNITKDRAEITVIDHGYLSAVVEAEHRPREAY